jgi:hypothetical protein
MSDFRVGDVVECVNPRAAEGCGWHGDALILGGLYTIEALGLCTDGAPGVILREQKRCRCTPRCRRLGDWYRSDRFRKYRSRLVDDLIANLSAPAPRKREDA